MFDLIPLQYLYGLRRIELRPRQSNRIGKPFAFYSVGDKSIILYSLPIVWRLDSIPARFQRVLEAYDAIVEKSADSVIVRWPDQAKMSIWYWTDVLMHELGHHFMHQYRHKNGTVNIAEAREFIADLHARRFMTALAAKIRGEGCAAPNKRQHGARTLDMRS
jgi:hypothetical protein